MTFSLKKAFQRAAMALVPLSCIAGAFFVPVENIIAGERPAADSCIYASDLRRDLKTNQQKNLNWYLEEIRSSKIGESILAATDMENTRICYDKALDNTDDGGYVTYGLYAPSHNMIKLNPNPKYAKHMTTTLIHEIRHRQQDDMGFRGAHDHGNYKETELMTMQWIKEADARLASVVFADEMLKQGTPKHMEALLSLSGYSHLAAAFTGAVRDVPDDVPQAMRTAVKTFRTNLSLACHYDSAKLDYLDHQINYKFDPQKPLNKAISDRALRNLGEMGPYGNYMNEELKRFIRKSVTQQDFRRLSRFRKIHDTEKEVCKAVALLVS